MYSTKELLPGVNGVSIKLKEIENLIMEMVSQVNAPTAISPVIIG
jgi:hypothetical protein